jgi:hypothetical protein
MADGKLSQEEAFAENLRDLVVLAQKLQPHVQSVEDLIAQIQGALQSEAHLKLLMSVIKQQRR